VRRSQALAVAATCIVISASSCGVPGDSEDRPLAPNEIAYRPLPEPTTSTTSTTTTPPATTAAPPTTTIPAVTSTTTPVAYPLDVYWIEGSLIRPVRRAEIEATLKSAIDALRAGPMFADSDQGLRSAIPGPDTIESAELQNGTATINLGSSFLTLPGAEQTLAIAQIVYTVTNQPGVGLVEFRLGGRALSVPTADGQPSKGALSRDDYETLLVPVVPVTETTTVVPIDQPAGTS
jgi:spore germination protein GerM